MIKYELFRVEKFGGGKRCYRYRIFGKPEDFSENVFKVGGLELNEVCAHIMKERSTPVKPKYAKTLTDYQELVKRGNVAYTTYAGRYNGRKVSISVDWDLSAVAIISKGDISEVLIDNIARGE